MKAISEGRCIVNKMLALAVLAGGVLLVIFGIAATHSLRSEVSEFFTGFPGNTAMWMLLGGVVLCVVGVASVMRRTRVAT
jgi:phosphatidylserine synthase